MHVVSLFGEREFSFQLPVSSKVAPEAKKVSKFRADIYCGFHAGAKMKATAYCQLRVYVY